MRFIDPLNGYKLAAGETLYHIVFFTTMFFLDFGDCVDETTGDAIDEYNFKSLCYFMWFVHAYRIVKIILESAIPLSYKYQVLTHTILEIFSIAIYIGATFMNQNLYFYYSEDTVTCATP